MSINKLREKDFTTSTKIPFFSPSTFAEDCLYIDEFFDAGIDLARYKKQYIHSITKEHLILIFFVILHTVHNTGLHY